MTYYRVSDKACAALLAVPHGVPPQHQAYVVTRGDFLERWLAGGYHQSECHQCPWRSAKTRLRHRAVLAGADHVADPAP